MTAAVAADQRLLLAGFGELRGDRGGIPRGDAIDAVRRRRAQLTGKQTRRRVEKIMVGLGDRTTPTKIAMKGTERNLD
jgi:hypothetical protein